MKICFVVEGAYPYVQGGVSSWVHSLITQMPEHEFLIQTIIAGKADSGKFRYKLPGNVTQVSEAVLNDGEANSRKGRRSLSKGEREAVRALLFHEDDRWDGFFDMFRADRVSARNLLMGPDFLGVVKELYDAFYGRYVFTDFLWTCRSMLLPLLTVMKSEPPEADAYHTVSTGYAGVMAARAGYEYGKPVILTEHGIYTREREEEIIQSKWTRGIYKDLWINHFHTLSRCVYRRAEIVYALFQRASDIQAELGCPRGKTRVAPNGVDFTRMLDVPERDGSDGCVNIGAIVRVVPIKDIKTMLSAYHYAKNRMPNLRLFIAGSLEENPGYYNECVELLRSLGAEDVTFTGHIDVRKFLGEIDISLLTSISEGQPISLLEAMAAGKACIATRVGDCAGILAADDPERRAGICVPIMSVEKTAEAIVRLAGDRELRRGMGENGRRIVKQSYRNDEMLETYRAAYRRLDAESPSLSRMAGGVTEK